MKKISKWMEQYAPTEIYEVCTSEELTEHLLFYQSDQTTVVATVETLPIKEKVGKKEKEKAPPFFDAVTAFEKQLAMLLTALDTTPASAIVSIQSKWSFQLNELLEFQRSLSRRLSFTPLILMSFTGKKKINISCIMGAGEKRVHQGDRLAFDLDDTLTRWPLFFSALSKKNSDPDSYNLITDVFGSDQDNVFGSDQDNSLN